MQVLLKGTVDFHVHCGPDVISRSVSAHALALDARASGMSAIYVKSHVAPTVGMAAAMSEAVPGLSVLGGIVLNTQVGGLNPTAVDAALTMGGRLVWMPTQAAANDLRYFGRDPSDGLTILDPDGRVRKSVLDILELIAHHGAGLCTGHLSYEESAILVSTALTCGVSTVVVTHPFWRTIGMSLDQQAYLAEEGAYIEYCWAQLAPRPFGVDVRVLLDSLERVGLDRVILSTDAGGASLLPPAMAMQDFQDLLRCELSPEETERVFRVNPSRALGLTV